MAIIGASGTYGTGILAQAEEIGVEAMVITRSPHKFKDVRPTTTVVEAQLDEEEKLREAFTGCDGVIWSLTRFSGQFTCSHHAASSAAVVSLRS